MCAVIGIIIDNPSKRDFETIRIVFMESKIRGLHATGISYVKNGMIETIKEPIPADKFVDKYMSHDQLREMIDADGKLFLIGHCRYSTSDLEFNQPISNSTTSVVHNGVITQELPEKWEELYGYKCETKNDTELLLHTIEENVSPLGRWQESSMAVCVLQSDKTLKVFRNGKRPLYLTALGNGCIITSTENIALRANINQPTTEIPMNTYVTFDDELTMMVEREAVKGEYDFQHYENTDN